MASVDVSFQLSTPDGPFTYSPFGLSRADQTKPRSNSGNAWRRCEWSSSFCLLRHPALMRNLS